MPPVVRKDGKFQNGVEGGEVKASDVRPRRRKNSISFKNPS